MGGQGGGMWEYRYRVSVGGTPWVGRVELPGGRQDGVEWAGVPAGWVGDVGAVSAVFTGKLERGQSVLLVLRGMRPPGEARHARLVFSDGTTLTPPVVAPGTADPRPLSAWTDAGGLHARFLVRPGESVAAMRSSDMSDWSDASDVWVMPGTSNILQLDRSGGSALFVRLRREVPVVAEVPALLDLPLDATWITPGPAQDETPLGVPVTLP